MSIMDRNKRFGSLVKTLRAERSFFDEAGRRKPWTQEHLIEQIKRKNDHGYLSMKQLGDIERGDVVNLSPDRHIAPLANALGLNELERIEFYAAANYIYEPEDNKQEEDGQETIRALLGEHQYPAYVLTPLLDVVAFNGYYRQVHGYTDEQIKEMHRRKEGINQVQIFFDPLFDRKTYRGGLEAWRKATIRLLRIFRLLSFRYMHTRRYIQIRQDLENNYDEFNRLWNMSSWESDTSINMPVEPRITTFHPDFGTTTFITLRFPQSYLGQDIHYGFHLPVKSSEETYSRIVDSVAGNDITFFGVRNKLETIP